MTTRSIDDRVRRSLRCSQRLASPLLLVLLLGCATAVPEGQQKTEDQDHVVCRVNGSEIHRSDVEAQKHKLLPAAGFHGSVDQADQEAMRRDALQSLIGDELEYQDARKRALSVDHKKVTREYTRLADRYGGSKAFASRIKLSGISEKEIRTALEREFLIADVRERVADAIPEISAQDTRRYFAENASSFQLPRRAEVRQILFSMPPLERDPDDWERAVERANTLRARVEAGEPFAQLAAEVSNAAAGDQVNAGLIGIVHPGQLETPLDAALWSLQPGEVSEPIIAFKGVYLLFVDNIIDARALTYDEIEAKLEQLLQGKRRQQALDDWRASLRGRAQIEILDPSLAPVTDAASEAI